ncbi:MAG TPA: hypothetical protein PKJ47_11700 [Candidatus Limiplasma sp.]|nr:hypothetical protein [Candidatus Limiplasma sp.]
MVKEIPKRPSELLGQNSERQYKASKRKIYAGVGQQPPEEQKTVEIDKSFP